MPSIKEFLFKLHTDKGITDRSLIEDLEIIFIYYEKIYSRLNMKISISGYKQFFDIYEISEELFYNLMSPLTHKLKRSNLVYIYIENIKSEIIDILDKLFDIDTPDQMDTGKKLRIITDELIKLLNYYNIPYINVFGLNKYITEKYENLDTENLHTKNLIKNLIENLYRKGKSISKTKLFF